MLVDGSGKLHPSSVAFLPASGRVFEGETKGGGGGGRRIRLKKKISSMAHLPLFPSRPAKKRVLERCGTGNCSATSLKEAFSSLGLMNFIPFLFLPVIAKYYPNCNVGTKIVSREVGAERWLARWRMDRCGGSPFLQRHGSLRGSRRFGLAPDANFGAKNKWDSDRPKKG